MLQHLHQNYRLTSN